MATILLKSMESINFLVTDILQNIFYLKKTMAHNFKVMPVTPKACCFNSGLIINNY